MVSDHNNKIDSIEKHVTLMIESYERICKKSFPIPGATSKPLEALHHNSEYAIVSHGLEKDPVFNYANLAAQKLWKLSWEEFIQLPSKQSAKPDKVAKRELLLKEALLKGYIENYEGIRIDKTGKEFFIKNVTLWNLIDKNGLMHGQAALFNKWEYL